MAKIKDLIREMREREQLTHWELSKLLRTCPPGNRVRGWEEGKTSLGTTQLEEICEVLGYDLEVKKRKKTKGTPDIQ